MAGVAWRQAGQWGSLGGKIWLGVVGLAATGLGWSCCPWLSLINGDRQGSSKKSEAGSPHRRDGMPGLHQRLVSCALPKCWWLAADLQLEARDGMEGLGFESPSVAVCLGQ